MSEPKKDKQFIHKPYFAGGMKAMSDFIRKQLKYPAEAAEHLIQGTVQLRYTIDYQGNVTDVRVIKHLGFGCDEEAERVVRLLKFEVKKPRHLRVEFHKTINIHFHPPKVVKTKPAYLYQYSESPKADNPAPATGGYSYTITFDEPK
ncbi:MAG: energy transducer TonB [Saprospiraceae bacterium]|mgnify:CR=1 FL=1|nr:energy transducer TonB [Saprospiraceae bacterium]MCB9321579.1 energy transducer TonB [Lewinellaceae bacterium]